MAAPKTTVVSAGTNLWQVTYVDDRGTLTGVVDGTKPTVAFALVDGIRRLTDSRNGRMLVRGPPQVP